MAIVKFTESDKLSAKSFDPIFYTFVVTKAPGARESTSKKSLNFDIDVQVASGPLKGKEHRIVFNTGMNQSSILGALQYEPHVRLIEFNAALNGLDKTSPAPDDLDTESFVGKKFDGKIVNDIVDGNPASKISIFLPEGKGSEAGVF